MGEYIHVKATAEVLDKLQPDDWLRVVGRGPKDTHGGGELILELELGTVIVRHGAEDA